MYNDNDSNDAGKVILSFIIGAAAGVAAGMLLSPDSGEANRKTVSRTANDWKNKANDLTTQLGSQLETKYKDIAGTVKTETKKYTKKANDLASEVNNNPYNS